ncbi:chemoreceptor glutamine deamidase CheD [Ralstonia sp. 22086]|nr:MULTISPECIES: chemoreceptor glutamine deamidase CheD [Ralstonia]MCT7305036.1 chemoreceptor glutamine deamidase CheD [Ralstonia wenshanensis]MDY7509458.1 chemoreceptor glutamine deamidase CheD [Ralstonia wenshanensis]UGS89441.1 chemoreceptor glutamine deamidase CheD [Ralstonia wenshanensis]
MATLAQSSASTHAYYDTTFGRRAMKVLPGEYSVTTEDLMLVTVLGSCVSACVRDKTLGIGGMNHFMLPSRNEGESILSPSMRYGTHAMEVLLNQLYKAGAKRERLEIKVFGGAAVLAGMSTLDVGERNGKFVLEFLRNEGLTVAAKDLFDVHPRKVYFVPSTGQIMVRKLRSQNSAAELDSEAQYASKLSKSITTKPASRLQLFT